MSENSTCDAATMQDASFFAKRGFSRSRQDLQQMDITREFEEFVWKVDPDADKLDK